MADLDDLLSALGPDPPPAPPPASFSSFIAGLAAGVLGKFTTDPEAIRLRLTDLLEAEGWRLVDRTAACSLEGGGRAFLAPPGPNEVVFLARTPDTEPRLAALVKIPPEGCPGGIPYLPMTPAAALLGLTTDLPIRMLECLNPEIVADYIQKEASGRGPPSEALVTPGAFFCVLKAALACRGQALVDWSGDAREGATLVLAENECAFAAPGPNSEENYARFVRSIPNEDAHQWQFLPAAVIFGYGAALSLCNLGPTALARAEAFALGCRRPDAESICRKTRGLLPEGWRLTDRTQECLPADRDLRRLAPTGAGELTCLRLAPESAPLFAAVARIRPSGLAAGETFVSYVPTVILLERNHRLRITEGSISRSEVLFLAQGAASRPGGTSGGTGSSGESCSGEADSGETCSGEADSGEADSGEA